MEVHWTVHIPQAMQRHTGSFGEGAFLQAVTSRKTEGDERAPAMTGHWSLAESGLPQRRESE
jgi:hypothetical protein